MESKTNTMNTNCDDSSSLIGQELVNFVIKASESLHNVLLKAKALPQQQTNKRRKSNFQTKYFKTKAYHSKRVSKIVPQINPTKNTEIKSNDSINSDENNLVSDSYGSQSNDNQCNYNMIEDIKWSDELKELPMEDFLSSPSWKQIVAQNSFLWPPNLTDV